MRGLRTMRSALLLATAGVLMGGAAKAGGSIGGDCCADLEERVAELEATTARKGNRKVSLTIYGQVNKAVVFIDSVHPGVDDVQIINNPLDHTGFGFEGEAKISSDLYAGYNIEFDVTDDTSSPLELTRNELFIASKTFGKVSIGYGALAADEIAEIDLSGTDVASASDGPVGQFSPAVEFTNLDGDEGERVRYDSPVFAGFAVSAAWQENDDFDVALRYGAKLGQFKLAAGIGYQELTAGLLEQEVVSGSISALHEPTGLSLTFAAGELEENGVETLSTYYVKAGIQRSVFSVGDTAASVDYQLMENGPAEYERYGFQLVQNIDAAAMELYLSAWTSESNISPRDEEDGLMIGSRIQF